MTPPIPSPKGSLEELFRHHLLESEAAAVPPLPHVWEQLDNSLLLAQNKRYRRRLAAYHWAMAASLLLTVLAGSGWWYSQRHAQPTAAVATASPTGNDAALASRQMGTAWSVGTTAAPYTTSTNLTAFPIEQTLTFSTSSFIAGGLDRYAASGIALADYLQHAQQQAHRAHYATAALTRSGTNMASRSALAAAPSFASAATGQLASYASTPDADAEGMTEAERLGAASLRMRLAALKLPARASLPARLEGKEVLLPVAQKRSSPWQLQVAYAGSLYDPNIDFTKLPGEYNGSLGPGTVATTREAAAEYRHNLRPGIGQRLSVWATRRFGIGRWGLRTGLEIAENTASSASSVGFVGEQVTTMNPNVQVLSSRLQGTSYRYRSVSIPVEAIYTNPVRQGFSLYGRFGALVSSMLQVHSEVDGNAEATRTYGIRSVGSPYRHVGASVRGGVGMRYEPADHQWALNVGPVAEAGILSLNIDPTQTFWNQHRPFSFGLEAGLEFKSLLKPTPPVPAP